MKKNEIKIKKQKNPKIQNYKKTKYGEKRGKGCARKKIIYFLTLNSLVYKVIKWKFL